MIWRITTQLHSVAKSMSAPNPWSSPKTQWSEQYSRVRPGNAERTSGIPHSSCWLERSIHILCFSWSPSSGLSLSFTVGQTFTFTVSQRAYMHTEKSTGQWRFAQRRFYCIYAFRMDKMGHYLSIIWVCSNSAAVPVRPVRGQCSSMKEVKAPMEGKKDWFLWILSLIRFHAVPELLAASIH